MSVFLPVAIAVGFFLTGLLIGMLCSMLKKAQVSVNLWLLSMSWPFHGLKAKISQDAHDKML